MASNLYAERDGHVVRYYTTSPDGDAVMVGQLSLRPDLSAGQLLTLASNLAPMLYVPPAATNGHHVPAEAHALPAGKRRGRPPKTPGTPVSMAQYAKRVLAALEVAGTHGLTAGELHAASGTSRGTWKYRAETMRRGRQIALVGVKAQARYYLPQYAPGPDPMAGVARPPSHPRRPEPDALGELTPDERVAAFDNATTEPEP